MTDNINSPAHYTTGNIETIDYMQDKLTAEQFEGYCVGNVMKYVTRYRHKNGVEDLKKGSWYLSRLIEAMKHVEKNNPTKGECLMCGYTFFRGHKGAKVCGNCKDVSQ